MPELPEVETIRRSLERRLLGRRVTGVEVRERRLRRPVAAGRLRQLVKGATFSAFDRRAKYLVVRLKTDAVLVFHLGMSGRIFLVSQDAPLDKHDHVCFLLDDGSELRFRDPRRFGLVEAVEASAFSAYPPFQALGMEPLSPGFNAEFLFTQTRRLKKPIKNFLMDAHVVVGVGNIYANEALFDAGIKPLRKSARLSREECERIVRAVKAVLERAIIDGGTTISDFFDSDGEAGRFQHALRVYDEAGKPCRRCGKPIRRKVLAGRSTFYCSGCQV